MKSTRRMRLVYPDLPCATRLERRIFRLRRTDRNDLTPPADGLRVCGLELRFEALEAPLDACGEPLQLDQHGLAVLAPRGLGVLHSQLQGAELEPEATVPRKGPAVGDSREHNGSPLERL